MLTTKFTETFWVDHPIVQGGMQWVGRAELVAAGLVARIVDEPEELISGRPADMFEPTAEEKVPA